MPERWSSPTLPSGRSRPAASACGCGQAGPAPSVAGQHIDGIRLVVCAEAVDDGGGGLVEADHFDLGALAAQFENDLVQRTHCGDIPEVRMSEIDGDFEQPLLEIERRHELIGGAEEDLPYHPVDTL